MKKKIIGSSEYIKFHQYIHNSLRNVLTLLCILILGTRCCLCFLHSVREHVQYSLNYVKLPKKGLIWCVQEI